MSVRFGLLALLEPDPMYGYQLRAEFEARTGGVWPLNVGQVYTTLSRLERDGLVEQAGADDEGRANYRTTDRGRAELRAWFATPVEPRDRPRDELAIKLALAVTTPGVDVSAVVQRQRSASIRALQDYTRLKARSDGDDLAWLLVLDAIIFATEAELRWLDHVESRLARSALDRPPRRSATSPRQPTSQPTSQHTADRNTGGVRR